MPVQQLLVLFVRRAVDRCGALKVFQPSMRGMQLLMGPDQVSLTARRERGCRSGVVLGVSGLRWQRRDEGGSTRTRQEVTSSHQLVPPLEAFLQCADALEHWGG